jgi:hypothetical protein
LIAFLHGLALKSSISNRYFSTHNGVCRPPA